METIYTLQEVAALLHMPYRTVRDAVFQGRWPHVRVSERRRLMTTDDVQATMALLRQRAKAPVTVVDARTQKKRVLEMLEAA